MTDLALDADLASLAELCESWAYSESFPLDDLITLRICINQIQKERNQQRSTIKKQLLDKLKRMRNDE